MTPDVIGTIYKRDGEYDEDGNVITPPTKLDGFHVNFQQEVPELAAYKLDPQPNTPVRVYAGGMTPVCYQFTSEAEFRELWPELEVEA